MTIGERIKKRRIELGMTQQELAEKIGYNSKTAISKIEMDERDLRQTKIKPIADALETTVEYIMGWEDDEITRKLDQFSANQVIIEAVSSMSEGEKQELLNYMRYILSKRQ